MASLIKYRKAKCHYCDKTNGLHIHHIIPRSISGTDEPHNLMTLCKEHHAVMHDMHEQASISNLTKIGLAKAKERGVVFGNRTNLQEAQAKGAAAVKAKADAFARRFRPMIERLRQTGMSIRDIAQQFNIMGVPTSLNGSWHPVTVNNILKRPA